MSKAKATLTIRRMAAIREMHSLERPQKRCAELLGMQAHPVSLLARQMGLKFSKRWSPAAKRANSDGRLVMMAALYRDGYLLSEIGDQYGITRERVRQLLTKHFGIRQFDGGQHIKAARKEAADRDRMDGRMLAKYGVTFEQWRELRDYGRKRAAEFGRKAKDPFVAYRNQRRNAAWRNIGWEITFWQWWTIWQQSGHWEERGRGSGYVMCRRGDVGPYSANNVYIATSIENVSKRAGRKHDLPTGVALVAKGKYRAYVAHRQIDGQRLRLGTFKTPELAHAAYLMAGEQTRAAA